MKQGLRGDPDSRSTSDFDRTRQDLGCLDRRRYKRRRRIREACLDYDVSTRNQRRKSYRTSRGSPTSNGIAVDENVNTTQLVVPVLAD